MTDDVYSTEINNLPKTFLIPKSFGPNNKQMFDAVAHSLMYQNVRLTDSTGNRLKVTTVFAAGSCYRTKTDDYSVTPRVGGGVLPSMPGEISHSLRFLGVSNKFNNQYPSAARAFSEFMNVYYALSTRKQSYGITEIPFVHPLSQTNANYLSDERWKAHSKYLYDQSSSHMDRLCKFLEPDQKRILANCSTAPSVNTLESVVLDSDSLLNKMILRVRMSEDLLTLEEERQEQRGTLFTEHKLFDYRSKAKF
ncbi:hypothetical protein PP301_gp046 [Gordonia phage GMA2]|uniref:Uncharacterized protein n=1 Tax=Gordonia phage GMA2 TaxID=1647283 RepID=A0A0K0N6M3_9CAUD|nr:hypothetical protein PP301_gp046 [Gordonia phage GMA2]AKJ72584.1 hypothetical protein GMA2_46 [Gordonia phage GMA2]